MSVLTDFYLEKIADYIDQGKAGGGSLTVDVSGAGDMQGCDAGTAGVHGLVPAPAAGDQDKVLHGDGTWRSGGSGGLPDYSNIIASGSYSNGSGFNYTATDDCWAFIMAGTDSASAYPTISINNTAIGWVWRSGGGLEIPLIIPLKAGDVLDVSAVSGGSYNETYIIYAI